MRADRKRRRRGRQIRAVYQIAVIVLLLMCYGKLDLVQGMAVDGLNQAMETRKDVMAIECAKEEDKPRKTSLSAEECEQIARVVMAEANTLEGMTAVAQVIYDRAVLWDRLPEEIIRQQGQFSEPYTGELSKEAMQAVSAVFNDGQRAFESNVTHFHSAGIKEPYWTKEKQYIGTVGGNKFWF